MCGLLGLLRWNGLEPGDARRIRKSAGVLAHRGPDGEGFWADGHCALGFRRLKILDLTPAGDQPMANENGHLHVVFNGEIYNHAALRGRLIEAGHHFASRADTEVLLHGYEEWGEEGLLERIRGMYAFALWDAERGRLLLARDPLGVKPLYFAERPGLLLFASEPKALFATGLVSAELDAAALHEALTYRYVPAPRSGFKDVEKLPAGHWALAENQTLRYRAGPVLLTPPAGQASSGDSPPLGQALSAAVEIRRTASDVPVGIWLSGGIDSSLVASHAGALPCFTAGFAQEEYDERPTARATAGHLRAPLQEFEFPAELFRLLPQVVWHADEPFFDSSALPTYALAELTRRNISVVLSGDGGDESFAGYERYLGMRHLERWKRIPRWAQRGLLAWARWRHPAPTRQGWDRLVRWLEKCARQEAEGFPAYLGAMTLFEQGEIRSLYGEELAELSAELDGREHLAQALKRAALRRHPGEETGLHLGEAGVLQEADLATYLPGDVLHKVDRMSMAHGLEVRSPFLDVDLVRQALALPDSIRLPGQRTKPLLRNLAEERLPPQVTRARKRGFGVPLDEWFRGPLIATALELFESSHLAADGVFRPRYWEPFWKAHQARQAQHGERLYALLALECWYRLFLSDAPALERPAILG